MEEEVTVDELKAAIRKGTIACQIHPVFVGSSYKNKGVQELLDAVVDYMPSPIDVPAIKGTNPDTGEEDERPSDVKAPFSALAFKIMTDPFVGKLTYLRVYSGQLDSGSYVSNASKGKKERIGRLLQMHSNQRVDIDGCAAGDIVAVVGLKDTSTGDTLCDADHPIILESMEFAEPVIDIAVEPKTKAEQDKMGIALQKLAEEDPTFRVSTNQETGQTIIAGMGELHLEIIVDRLLREFKVEANVGKPQVAYRETATQEARNVEGKFVRQSGGRGQYGHAVINLIPQEPGAGYEFVDEIVGGKIPRGYLPAIDKGVQDAMREGFLAGYPMEDIKCAVYDGSYHSVDSNEMAFKTAARIGFRAACEKADPILLEPMANLDVLFLVASTTQPTPSTLVLDKLSAIAVDKGVQPVIVCTKGDLAEAEFLRSAYEKSTLPFIRIDYATGEGLDDIKHWINGRLCAFCGNSGVGKSTLLNALLPDVERQTAAISQKLGRGRHTTREVTIFEAFGGRIADTPGFASLEASRAGFIPKENLEHAFPEFGPYLGACQFTGCSHRSEKGCAVRAALAEGKLSQTRYDSYCAMYDEVKDVKEWQRRG